MSRKAHFFRQITQVTPYKLNLDTSNTDHISLNHVPTFPGIFDWKFKFNVTTETSSFAPIIGADTGRSRVQVSFSLGRIQIQLGESSSIVYNYPFTSNTDYTLRIRRDSSDDIYMTVNGGTEILVGNKSGSFGNGTIPATVVYIGRASTRYFGGYIEYVNLGGNDNYQLNEGSGATVNSQIGGNSGTIQTTQDINYINNTMWQQV